MIEYNFSRGLFGKVAILRGKRDLHNGDDLSETQEDTVHLSDEYAGDGDEERGTIHVDIATDRQDESGDSRVDSELLGHQTKSYRKCGSPVQNCVSKNRAKHTFVDGRKIHSTSPVVAVLVVILA